MTITRLQCPAAAKDEESCRKRRIVNAEAVGGGEENEIVLFKYSNARSVTRLFCGHALSSENQDARCQCSISVSLRGLGVFIKVLVWSSGPVVHCSRAGEECGGDWRADTNELMWTRTDLGSCGTKDALWPSSAAVEQKGRLGSRQSSPSTPGSMLCRRSRVTKGAPGCSRFKY